LSLADAAGTANEMTSSARRATIAPLADVFIGQ